MVVEIQRTGSDAIGYAQSRLDPSTGSTQPSVEADSNLPQSFGLGVYALQQLGVICREQDRLRSQYLTDVSKAVSDWVLSFLRELRRRDSEGMVTTEVAVLASYREFHGMLADLQRRCRESIDDMLQRQQLDLQASWAMDIFYQGIADINRSARARQAAPSVTFRHTHIFAAGQSLLEQVLPLLRAAVSSSTTISIDNANSTQSSHADTDVQPLPMVLA